MFELGPEKIMIVLAAVFIFLGPKELPAAARTIGEGMRKLRALQDTLRSELGSALELPPGPSDSAETSSEADADRSVTSARDEAGFSSGPSSFT